MPIWRGRQSLKKSVALFDPQIEGALKSDSEFIRTEDAGHLLGSTAISVVYLAVVYLREGRTIDAIQISELAYEDVNRPHVQATFMSGVVKVGNLIAQQSGDESAIARWSQRSPR